MCGIAAVFGDLPEERNADAARDLMRHRGPDDRGSFRAAEVWLASRRLAIIDIGPAGRQPFVDAETGVVIVFNGEIYNYLELRHDLECRGHHFRSESDTEVLLRAYLEWGERCIGRLNGMWAFVIWDPRQHCALICRDRFGVKPMFVAQRASSLAIASEPKVLLALYPELRRPNVGSLVELLALKRVYANSGSFYESISVFPAAHYAIVRPAHRKLNPISYWQMPHQQSTVELAVSEADEEFASLFEDAVRLRLRSDVPLGVTLSGGLDSTAIVQATRDALPPEVDLTAYTSVYGRNQSAGEGDESAWAEVALAEQRNSELRRVPATEEDWVGTLRQIVWHMDGPGFSPAVFPLWNIARQARAEGVKVLLEGQGADELLGGYSWHAAAALIDNARDVVRRPHLIDLWSFARAVCATLSRFGGRRVGGHVATQLLSPVRSWDLRRGTVAEALKPDLRVASSLDAENASFHSGQNRVNKTLLSDFTLDLLPGFLHYGDAVMMAHSVENRLPFMDYRLAEWAFRMPGDYKVRAGQSKAPLRAYLHAVGQHRIAERKRKEGYPTPANKWMAARGGALLKELLLDRDARVREYVQPQEVANLIDRHVAGRFAAGDSLFSLVSTELWLQECIHIDPPPD